MANLPDFALARSADLDRGMILRHFEAHADLFLEGERPLELYSVLEGRVKLWRADEDGRACTLLLLGRGELLGSIAVAQGTPQITSATALDQVVVACWPAALFRDSVRQDPRIADSFLLNVARRARQLLDRFGDIATAPIEERLARLLLRLTGEFGEHDDDLAVRLRLRQQEVAEMALTTVPTVSRILGEWKREGIVETGRGGITIPHMSRLAAVAGIHLD